VPLREIRLGREIVLELVPRLHAHVLTGTF
jgi:hypothetical protein